MKRTTQSTPKEPSLSIHTPCWLESQTEAAISRRNASNKREMLLFPVYVSVLIVAVYHAFHAIAR